MLSIDLKRSLKYNYILKLFFCVFVIASFMLLINYGVRFTNFISYKPETGDVSDGSEFFRQYMKDFGKEYNETEFAWRLKIFLKSKAVIEELNEQSRGQARYGFNKFSDLHIAEFEDHMGYGKDREKRDKGLRMSRPIHRECGRSMKPRSDIVFNVSITKLDWRDKGAVGPVLNQGSKCPACWAFSTVGVMESMAVIQYKVPYRRLSIQEVIDTSDEKCAMARVSSIVSILCNEQLLIATEWEYPLKLRNESVRPLPAAGWRITRMDQYFNVTPEFVVRRLQHGPLITTVNSYLWQFYLDGVIQYSCRGDMKNLIHVVQIVGYNLETPVPYYIIRNSWGTDWGMDGYVKVAMADFVCGVGREIISIEVAYQDAELEKDSYYIDDEDESDYVQWKIQLEKKYGSEDSDSDNRTKKLTSDSTSNAVDSRNPESKEALLPQNNMTPQAVDEQAGTEVASLVIINPVVDEKLGDSEDPSVPQHNTVPVVDDKARSEDAAIPQHNTVPVVDDKARYEDAAIPQHNTVPVVDDKARSEDAAIPQHNTVPVVDDKARYEDAAIPQHNTVPVVDDKARSEDAAIPQHNTVPVVEDKARSEDAAIPQHNTVPVVDEKTRFEDGSVPQDDTVPVVDEKTRSEDGSVPQDNTVPVVGMGSGCLETTTPEVEQTTSDGANTVRVSSIILWILWIRNLL